LITDRSWIEVTKRDFPGSVELSARTGENIQTFVSNIEEHFIGFLIDLELVVPHSHMELVDFFYKNSKINRTEYLSEGVKINLSIDKQLYNRIRENKSIKFIN